MRSGKITFGSIAVGLVALGASPSAGAAYDTAWTYVYDAGPSKDGLFIEDTFRDVELLDNGDLICAGETRDTSFLQNVLLTRLSAEGKLRETKLYRYLQGTGATEILEARNGDLVVGGRRSTSPLVMRLSADLAVKSSTWYHDSVQNRSRLLRSAIINSMYETPQGVIRATAGDLFPNNDGQNLNNYAAYLEFDGEGNVSGSNEWNNVTGYEIGGWSIALGEAGGVLLGGNLAVFYLDATGNLIAKNQFPFNVPGAGSQFNKVLRVRTLRDGSVVAVGQSYEEDCWTRYGRLYYDAWWSTLNASGGAGLRKVAGVSGADDVLWDLAQLADGRIAFAGAKGTASDSGLWVFVTDSTATNILWQKQFNLPGSDQGSTRSNLLPLAMAATADSGFAIVGMESAKGPNKNAFAFRFKAAADPVSATKATAPRFHRVKGGWSLSFVADGSGPELSLFDLDGRFETRMRGALTADGRMEFRFDPARWGRGTRIWRLETGTQVHQGRLCL